MNYDFLLQNPIPKIILIPFYHLKLYSKLYLFKHRLSPRSDCYQFYGIDEMSKENKEISLQS